LPQQKMSRAIGLTTVALASSSFTPRGLGLVITMPTYGAYLLNALDERMRYLISSRLSLQTQLCNTLRMSCSDASPSTNR